MSSDASIHTLEVTGHAHVWQQEHDVAIYAQLHQSFAGFTQATLLTPSKPMASAKRKNSTTAGELLRLSP